MFKSSSHHLHHFRLSQSYGEVQLKCLEFFERVHHERNPIFLRGLTVLRQSLNVSYFSLQAMADVVKAHLDSGVNCSRQLPLRCPMCVNPTCGLAKEFFLNRTL